MCISQQIVGRGKWKGSCNGTDGLRILTGGQAALFPIREGVTCVTVPDDGVGVETGRRTVRLIKILIGESVRGHVSIYDLSHLGHLSLLR